MTTRHHKVAGKKEYVEKCYCPYDLLNNNGGLILVSPNYFPFAIDLIKAINSVTRENDFLSLGNEFMDWEKKRMNEDTNLKISFLNCKNAIKLKDSECLKIFDEICMAYGISQKIGRMCQNVQQCA